MIPRGMPRVARWSRPASWRGALPGEGEGSVTRFTRAYWDRLAVGATVVLIAIAVGLFLVALATPGAIGTYLGNDYVLYMAAARRWLETGAFYQPWQAAPYPMAHGAVLYPPVALLLFAPFTLLPSVAWWLVPIALTGWSIWRLRPARWAWPFMAVCVLWPVTPLRYVNGNPVIWVAAFLALGCVYAGPAVLVLLKPTLLPFAFVGFRSPRWWLALAALALASIPFGGMWIDWYRAVANGQGSGGLLYSVQEAPILLLPLVAWLGRRHVQDDRHALRGPRDRGERRGQILAPGQAGRPAR